MRRRAHPGVVGSLVVGIALVYVTAGASEARGLGGANASGPGVGASTIAMGTSEADGAREGGPGSPAVPVPATRDINGDGLDDLALYGDPNRVDTGIMELPPWPVRVVFGRSDNAFVDVRAPGPWGYILDGPFGWGVSTVGDVNGDGRADILVSLLSSGTSEAVVVYGQSATGTVTTGAPSDQFRISGRGLSFDRNFFVFGVGDVNADGFDDLGARYNGEVANRPRKAKDDTMWLIYGRRQPADVDVDRLGQWGSPVRAPRAPHRWRHAGTSLGGIGDVDGDRIDDVAVGASWYPGRSCVVDTGGTGQRCNGRAWVIYGRRKLSARIDVAKLGRRRVTVIANPGRPARNRRYSQLGTASSATGDLDDDGFDDVLLEVDEFGRRGLGAIIWGSRLARRPRRVVLRARTSRVPSGHVPIGDFDGDGRADLLGLPDLELEDSGFRVFLVRGHRWAGRRPLDPRRPADGHLLVRDSFGQEIPTFAAGDINGDGRADVSTGPHGPWLAGLGSVIFGSSDRQSVAHPESRGFGFGAP